MGTLPELPLLLSPLSEELTPELDVTSPTLLEPSTSPRGRLRLMPTTWEDTELDTPVSDTGLGHAGLGYAGLGYAGLGYAGLGHHAVGYSNVSPSASLNIAGAAPAAVPAVGGAYAGAGRYLANSAGIIHAA